MFRRSVVYIVFLFIPLLSIECSLSAGVQVKLNEKDTAGTIDIVVGDTLEIMLKGNPTTGYIWEAASVDTSVLSEVREPEFRPESDARGSGGKIVMNFRAISVGKTLLKLIYHRPFEKNKPPIKVFSVDVMVSAHP